MFLLIYRRNKTATNRFFPLAKNKDSHHEPPTRDYQIPKINSKNLGNFLVEKFFGNFLWELGAKKLVEKFFGNFYQSHYFYKFLLIFYRILMIFYKF